MVLATQDASLAPLDIRLLPLYLSALSTLLLLGGWATRHSSTGGERTRPHVSLQALSKGPGGGGAFAFSVVRLASLLALLALSVYSVSVERSTSAIVTLAFYAYVLILSLFTIATPLNLAYHASYHLPILLLSMLAVYTYRDVWPLLTYTLVPEDRHEGATLWIKVAFLVLAAVVVPLFSPRYYLPVSLNGTRPAPTEEQTASIVSLMTYAYMDGLFLSKNGPIRADTLPGLADFDHAEVLVERGAKNLDIYSGAPRRHLFFGVMKTFFKEYVVLFILLLLRGFAALGAPVGINGLLKYIESNGEGAVYRPFVWILLMFLSPTMQGALWQWYVFIVTHTLVQTQAIITNIVFEHSLRVRMIAETGPAKGAQAAAASQPAKGRKDGIAGRLTNLVTTDLDNITDGRDFLLPFFYSPLQIILVVWFLYYLLGWSAFVGLACMILSFPVPGIITKATQKIQRQAMQKTDARVQAVSEMMNVIRMVKLFGWQTEQAERVASKRNDELSLIRSRELWGLASSLANIVIPVLQLISSYSVFTIVMHRELTPSIVFSSITLFEILQSHLSVVFGGLSSFVQAKVSLDRLTEFLHSDHSLLDEFSPYSDSASAASAPDKTVLGFKDAHFSWDEDTSGATDVGADSGARRFNLHVPGTVTIEPGCVTLVAGPTGSGKTSLFMALLGEMYYAPKAGSWFNLPREGGVSYAAQESWVLNATIRENIVFGRAYDEARYNKVVHACALERDLSLFAAGDMTEVGEKGITLSGGQKARVTLARAIYSTAQVVLLDDVLSALDVHTSRWIVDKCLKSDLVRGRTVILITHHVALATTAADYIITVRSGVVEQPTRIGESASSNIDLLDDSQSGTDVGEDAQAKDSLKASPPVSQPNGKLIAAEEIIEGRGVKSALAMYYAATGGRFAFAFWATFLVCIAAAEALNVLKTFWLGHWAEQYDHLDTSQVNVAYYLGGLVLILLASFVALSVGFVTYLTGALRASKAIHQSLINAILGTTFRWLDTTPISRVISRCTQDIRALDGPVMRDLRLFINKSATLLSQLIAIVVISPIFVVPSIVVFVLGWWIGKTHLAVQMPVTHIRSIVRAPVLGHFGSATAGIVSLRAYGAQSSFRKELHRRINEYSRISRTQFNLNRWLSFRIDMLSGLFSASLGAYLVYGPGRHSLLPSTVGFSLTMAVGFSRTILWWMRIINSLEVNNSTLERLEAYIEIEQEAEPKQVKPLPAAWPSSGELVVRNLSSSYSPGGPRVLHDLSFHVKSGERIGIVGRTGSGKTSLTLSLLRAIVTEGSVLYDGADTGAMRLEQLRGAITIIPQAPELLSGTLRANLDPFGEHEDAALNAALGAAGLHSLQAEDTSEHITLDTQIAGGGTNLSLGQRQILALARALVRGSKLLILDEATSSIDHRTDSVIQTSLRTELGSDVTLLTVAHRLRSVMDADKIMVLDAGRIVEFDKPSVLLQRAEGYLRALVDESEDRDALYAMVR